MDTAVTGISPKKVESYKIILEGTDIVFHYSCGTVLGVQIPLIPRKGRTEII